MFERDVLELLNKLFEKHDYVIMAGGSGLYINAVCNGFDELPETDMVLRNQLQEEFAMKGMEYLQSRLKQLDPIYYNEVDLSNPQRIIKALEVCISSGLPYSSFRKGLKIQRDFHIIKIGLQLPREELYNRINKRVEKMMNDGLLEEATTLFHHRERNALQTVGYQELFDHLDGKISLSEATKKIKQNTRRFAKRQMTWFRREKEIEWFETGNVDEILEHLHWRL